MSRSAATALTGADVSPLSREGRGGGVAQAALMLGDERRVWSASAATAPAGGCAQPFLLHFSLHASLAHSPTSRVWGICSQHAAVLWQQSTASGPTTSPASQKDVLAVSAVHTSTSGKHKPESTRASHPSNSHVTKATTKGQPPDHPPSNVATPSSPPAFIGVPQAVPPFVPPVTHQQYIHPIIVCWPE